MKYKFALASLSLIFFMSLAACTETNGTEESPENDSIAEEGTDETPNDSFEDNFPAPPNITIQVGDETLNPVPGTYSWSVDNEDGTITATEADTAPPPELVRTTDAMEVTEDTPIELHFEAEPDRYSVRIWNEENNVISESDEVDLSGEGEVIYEVLAYWDQGSATYAFSLIIE